MPPALRIASRRSEGRPGAFDSRQLALDQLRRGPLAALLDPVGELELEPVAVGGKALDVRIVRIGLGHQVEQVEGAAGRGRQVGGDRGDDAAGGAGDDERRLGR